jgi:O-antigen ligase
MVGSTYGVVAVAAAAVWLRAPASWVRVAALIVGLICLGCVVMSESRAAMLGLLAAAVSFGLAANWRFVLAVFVGVAGVLGAAALLGAVPVESLLDRGSSGRIALWLLTWDALLETPLLGIGAAGDYAVETADGKIHQKAHNVLLGTGYHLGALGVGILVLLIARVLWGGFRQAIAGRGEYLAALIFGSTILMFNSHSLVEQPKISWLVFWLPTVLLIQEEMRGPQPLIPEDRRTESRRR